jgi:hypothetical protein
MNAAIRAAAARFPALTEAELVALQIWKLRYALRSQGFDPAEADLLARRAFALQVDLVCAQTPTALQAAVKVPALALPQAPPARPRATRLCAYGLLALAFVLLVLVTTQG